MLNSLFFFVAVLTIIFDSLFFFLLQIRVNGPDAAPVYKFLKAKKSGFLGSRIKWNFTKFLVDKEGRVLRRYGTTTPPFAIEVLLLSPLSAM